MPASSQDEINIYYLWLQMCWHRQRLIVPGHTAQLPSVTSYHHLRFTYCCKILGQQRRDNNSLICWECYNRFPDNKYKSHYHPFHYHFTSDGIIRPEIACTVCFKSILMLRTLRECDPCRQSHLQFLTAVERTGQNIEDFGNPIILYISGDQLSF